MSAEREKVIASLLAAQKEIDSVVKTETGKITTKTGASYEYKYANLASVLDETKETLNKHGILLIQAPEGDERGTTVTTLLVHESTQWIESSLWLPVTMGSPQAYGAAIAYARRYQLQSLLALKTLDEDAPETPKKKPNTATQVAKDALDEMSAEDQELIRLHAASLQGLFESGGNMHDYLSAQKLTQEEKLALWALLPSALRAKLKKEETATKMSSEAWDRHTKAISTAVDKIALNGAYTLALVAAKTQAEASRLLDLKTVREEELSQLPKERP